MHLIVNFSLEWSWARQNRRTFLLMFLYDILTGIIYKQHRRAIPLIPEINRAVHTVAICLSIY